MLGMFRMELQFFLPQCPWVWPAGLCFLSCVTCTCHWALVAWTCDLWGAHLRVSHTLRPAGTCRFSRLVKTSVQGYVGMNQGDSEQVSVAWGLVPCTNWYYNPLVPRLGTFYIGNRAIVPSSGIESSHPPDVHWLFYCLWVWRRSLMVRTAVYYPCDVLGGTVSILYPTYASV